MYICICDIHKDCMSLLTCSLQLKAKCPRLENVTEIAVEIISQTSFSPTLHRHNHQVQLSLWWNIGLV